MTTAEFFRTLEMLPSQGWKPFLTKNGDIRLHCISPESSRRFCPVTAVAMHLLKLSLTEDHVRLAASKLDIFPALMRLIVDAADVPSLLPLRQAILAALGLSEAVEIRIGPTRLSRGYAEASLLLQVCRND